jgi:CRP/FNR family transcriptional regulator, anaerobic regulatory protein
MTLRRELAKIVNLEAGARVFGPGSYLYRQGEACASCFVLLSGWVALSTLLDDGSCQTLDFALPGSVLGLQSKIGGGIYHSAQCLSVSRAYVFPYRKLESVVEANPRLAMLLCRQIAAGEARAHDHLTNLGLRDARGRIAHLLLELYVRLFYRLPATPGEVISVPLSQSQIGAALGLTHVHVCRTLQTLREEKVIRLTNRKLEIISPRALLASAGIDVDRIDNEADEMPDHTELGPVWANDLLPAGWVSTSEYPVLALSS